MKVITINPGHNVLCDLCGADFTNSDKSGGFLFVSKAVCPNCADRFEKSINEFNEQEHIKARCPEGMSFADWVRKELR